jgi:hypothetical protein
MARIFLLLCIIPLLGCSTVAESTAAFVVAEYSKEIEKNSRVYKGIDKCFVEGRPEAFLLAESIVYGNPITHNYQAVLNPEMRNINPIPPHHLAYAFYIIADRLADSRAFARKKWIEGNFEPGEAERIEQFIDRKYLESYLQKCFYVPEQYKKYVRPRDVIDSGYVPRPGVKNETRGIFEVLGSVAVR